jgi:hypothetical protein
MAIPDQQKIYHIVHVDRLAAIVQNGALLSDAEMLTRPEIGTTIGMSAIKERRLTLPVSCHPGTCVGDYVPFYFCPRSIMLYLIYRGNHPDLSYRGGQDPILHLEADLYEVVEWANRDGRKWAFSLANAGARYTEFRGRVDQFGEVNWAAVAARDWTEFLVNHSLPWQLIRQIGVHSFALKQQVEAIISASDHRPPVHVRTDWYY